MIWSENSLKIHFLFADMVIFVPFTPKIELIRLSNGSFNLSIRSLAIHYSIAKVEGCNYKEFIYNLPIINTNIITNKINTTHSETLCIANFPFNLANYQLKISGKFDYLIANLSSWSSYTANQSLQDFDVAFGKRKIPLFLIIGILN